MIPIVRQYHRNPVYLKNIYNDEYCGGKQDTFKEKVNIVENETNYTIDLVAPGYNKDEIKITIEKDELNITSVEKGNAKNIDSTKFLRKEFVKSPIKRSFKLPENAEGEKIEASHQNGILSIIIPKKAKVEVPVKDIEVK